MAAKKQSTGKGMQKWDEELARRAEMASKMEESSLGTGNTISLRGGIMSYQDSPIPGNKLNAVILDHVYENAWYKEDFDSDNPTNPDCFALGKDEKTLAPHEKAVDPQCDRCIVCPLGGKEAWGSSDKGRGKACKNSRRLILITEGGLEDVEGAQVAKLRIPVMSVKGWAGYVKSLKDTLKRPTLGVITEISVVPDAKSQFRLQFKLKENVPNDKLDALFAKCEAAQQELMAPYTPMEDDGGKGAKGRGNGRAKAGAKATRKAPPKRAGRGR